LALLGFANLDRFGNQGCTILIIGAGVGGDVIGALSQVGATVICLEPDKAQFPHLAARVKLARNGQEKDATFSANRLLGNAVFSPVRRRLQDPKVNSKPMTTVMETTRSRR
jgi:hypothetical protein